MESNKTPGSLIEVLVSSPDAHELSWLLASLSPWAEVDLPAPKEGTRKPLLPNATLVAREGIKATNRICDTVTAAFLHYKEITIFKKAVNEGDSWVLERDKIGMAIRRWDAQGGHWKVQVIFAILIEAMQSDESKGKS